jgi:hypothetical protein
MIWIRHILHVPCQPQTSPWRVGFIPAPLSGALSSLFINQTDSVAENGVPCLPLYREFVCLSTFAC